MEPEAVGPAGREPEAVGPAGGEPETVGPAGGEPEVVGPAGREPEAAGSADGQAEDAGSAGNVPVRAMQVADWSWSRQGGLRHPRQLVGLKKEKKYNMQII